MKHAILILAHKNIDQLCRLVSVLNDDDFDIFIHFDKKFNVSQDDIKKLESKNKNINICKERISCMLDTWSLVEATYCLIKLALSKEEKYSYFLLLSGQDYPIKPLSVIKERLNGAYPIPLIDCTPYDKDNWIASGFSRIRNVPLHYKIDSLTENKILRKILKLPIYAGEVIHTTIVGSPISKLEKCNCDLYGGSAWWILPYECMTDICKEIENNSEIVKAFKLKTTPEETFFQTMVMRSKYKDMVVLNDIYETKQNCETFAYFEDTDKPATGHPYVLTLDEFEKLKNRKELFARKFDLNFDEKIFDRIDTELLNL